MTKSKRTKQTFLQRRHTDGQQAREKIKTAMRSKIKTTWHWSEWPSLKSLNITSARRVWRKGNPSTLLVELYVGAATMENCTEVPQKTTNRVAMWSSNPTPKHIPRGNPHWKRHMYPNVHCSTIHISQSMETNVHSQMNAWRRCGTYIQWNTTQP